MECGKMIVYVVGHGDSMIEFAALEDAELYATEHDLEAPEEVEKEDTIDTTLASVVEKIQKAKNEFNDLSSEVAAENVLMGITQAGKTRLIADTLSKVLEYGISGSLYEVINEIDRIDITPEMSPFITQERLDLFKLKIQAVLNSL